MNNKINGTVVILMGTETVEPGNFGKKYEELTLSANSSDTFENMEPGDYYICAVYSRQDYAGCIYSKRVVVKAGENAVVNVVR